MEMYRVSGNGCPDPNGYYPDAGEYNGEPYYERQDSAFAIWYQPLAPCWHLTTAAGAVMPGEWHRWPNIEGTYDPDGTYTGNPVVERVTPAGSMALMGVGR